MRKEDTVKLISAEGFEFIVHKDAAMVSQTIRNMLTSPGKAFSFSNLFDRGKLGFEFEFHGCFGREFRWNGTRRGDVPWDQHHHSWEDLQVFLLESSIRQVLILFFRFAYDFSSIPVNA